MPVLSAVILSDWATYQPNQPTKLLLLDNITHPWTPLITSIIWILDGSHFVYLLYHYMVKMLGKTTV